VPNINAFRPVVQVKKIFKDLSKVPHICLSNDPFRENLLDLNNLNPHSLEILPAKFS